MATAAKNSGLHSQSLAELICEIKELLRGAWRYRWHAILIMWVVCLPLWFYVLTMPDIFKATGRLHIDSEDSLRPLLDGLAIQADLLDDVDFMLKSIVSRPMLEKIAQRAGLDAAQLGALDEEKLLDRLQDNISMTLDPNQILEISVRNSNPRVAMIVVSVLIDEFVEGLLGSTRSDTKSAQRFLTDKLDDYEKLLATAEERLADFKKRNIGQMPDERGNYYARLQAEMRTLEDLDSKIRLTRQRRDDLRAQMVGEAPVFGVMTPSPGSGVAESPQIAQLEEKLTELRLSFTDEHPDVVRTKALIAELRKQQQVMAPTSSAIPDSPVLDQNPVFQQMKMQFNEADIELSQLQTQRNHQATVVGELRKKIDTIPEIEAELTRLNRNYDVYKRQHEELLSRLEQARLSEDAGRSTTSMNFQIIDPPTVTSSPIGPNRLLLFTLILMLATAAAGVYACARSITSPVLYSAQKLEQLFATRVLGSIKTRVSPAEHRRSRIGLFLLSIACVSLVFCYGLLVVLEKPSVRMVDQLTTMAGL